MLATKKYVQKYFCERIQFYNDSRIQLQAQIDHLKQEFISTNEKQCEFLQTMNKIDREMTDSKLEMVQINQRVMASRLNVLEDLLQKNGITPCTKCGHYDDTHRPK